MAWIVLLTSAVLEAVWASALGASDGLTRPGPSIVFGVACTLSMLGLGWALKSIPVGTAYAIWTGIGAALTVAWAMATGNEPVELLRVLFLGGIVAAVIGLKLVGSAKPAEPGTGQAQAPRPETTEL